MAKTPLKIIMARHRSLSSTMVRENYAFRGSQMAKTSLKIFSCKGINMKDYGTLNSRTFPRQMTNFQDIPGQMAKFQDFQGILERVATMY